jgi:hypothetical protein
MKNNSRVGQYRGVVRLGNSRKGEVILRVRGSLTTSAGSTQGSVALFSHINFAGR